MPLYEYPVNATNKIEIDPQLARKIVTGTDMVLKTIFQNIADWRKENSRACRVAFDGNYGVDWAMICELLQNVAGEQDMRLEFMNISTAYCTAEEICGYKQQFITDDPSFGYENERGEMQEIMDDTKISALRERLYAADGRQDTAAVIVYAPGAAVPALSDIYDMRFYFETTTDSIMWKMWAGNLVPLGKETPDDNYIWKELYYNDFHMLSNQKWYAFEHMDFFVMSVDAQNLQLVPQAAYQAIITTLLRYPIKQISVFMPGPWGAYRFKDFWKVPGLSNSAWNNIASPKLDVEVDAGNGIMLRLPSVNLLQYGDRLVGKYWDEEVPKWWPLIAALDDGYFPDADTPLERTAMPIHNHPSTDYVRRNFGEQFGRYETYYIVEAYEGASTLMGFKETADLEEWERKCWEADKDKSLIPDWRDYINVWETRVGDLFLIPPGTTHGHGGRQMVLELDTTVNTTTCEYSFFMHDYGRHTWDDHAKSMTGKPMRLHVRHGFNIEKWRRKQWVKDHLRAKPIVKKWTKQYSMEQYTTLPEMPFHIERFRFKNVALNDTEGKFMQIVTLTVGKNVTIRSLDDPSRCTTINWLQAAVIPADFGAYEFVNEDGSECTIVQIRMKKG